MNDDALGTRYADGEVICRQGEPGDRMYVMQAGHALVSRAENGHEMVLGELKPGDIFGEMAIFEREPRSATVRAHGSARVLTLDKRGFLKRVHEDPSLAYRILRDMSRRVRTVSRELAQRHGGAPAPRFVLVVAADRPELFERLDEAFAADPGVQVVVDRRVGERRRRAESPDRDRREQDRRQRKADDNLLKSDGFLVIRAHPRA